MPAAAATASHVIISSREDINLQTELDAGGGQLSTADIALIAASRTLRMNACFFAAVDVKIATPRVQSEPANLLRNVAFIPAADWTKIPAVFFDRSLVR